MPGGELCLSCLKEMARRLSPSGTEDELIPDDAALEIDSVSTMDEIVIDIDDEELPADAFAGDEEEEKEEEEEQGRREFRFLDPLDDEELSWTRWRTLRTCRFTRSQTSTLRRRPAHGRIWTRNGRPFARLREDWLKGSARRRGALPGDLKLGAAGRDALPAI